MATFKFYFIHYETSCMYYTVSYIVLLEINFSLFNIIWELVHNPLRKSHIFYKENNDMNKTMTEISEMSKIPSTLELL